MAAEGHVVVRNNLGAYIDNFDMRVRDTIHNGAGKEEFEQTLSRPHGHSVPRVPEDEEEV